MRLIKPSHEILTPINGEEILKSIEQAGRTCYKSENKITELSARQFVANILKRGHESVIEHVNISVKFICDRGVTHELVRHRLAAYSQESTRYCNYKGGVTFVIPPWINVEPGEYKTAIPIDPPSQANDCWFDTMLVCEVNYISAIKDGWTPQQARSVLPNSLKTEIVMTANVREWRHVLRLRTSKAAHPQMQQLMIPLLKEFKEKIPVLFDDIPEPVE